MIVCFNTEILQMLLPWSRESNSRTCGMLFQLSPRAGFRFPPSPATIWLVTLLISRNEELESYGYLIVVLMVIAYNMKLYWREKTKFFTSVLSLITIKNKALLVGYPLDLLIIELRITTWIRYHWLRQRISYPNRKSIYIIKVYKPNKKLNLNNQTEGYVHLSAVHIYFHIIVWWRYFQVNFQNLQMKYITILISQ